jgi:hypothetical protein
MPRGCSVLCPQGWLGESHAVHVAHLLGLQAMQAALKAGDGETWHGSFLKADTYWDWVPFRGV